MLSNFNLTAGEVYIWCVNLDQPPERCSVLTELLSTDESERTLAFYFDKDRRRYTVARAVLRILLGYYVNTNPRDLKFDYNARGKPSLTGCSSLQFNVSHSHERAVYAFGSHQALGIDLEYMRLITDMEEVARHSFSAHEYAVFDSVPAHLKRQAFFNCWTRKEAYIKALGYGLSHSLDSFDVTFLPGETARLLRVGDCPDEASQWTLRSFNFAEDYVAALATRQMVKRVVFRDWDFSEA